MNQTGTKFDRMSARKSKIPDVHVLLPWIDEYIAYHADGSLSYKKDPRNPDCTTSKHIGRVIRSGDGHGYISCRICGIKMKAHQVVWMIWHREYPACPIDHINRVRTDNRIENLRLARDIQNMQNLGTATRPNAGVWRSPRSGRYMARVTHNHKKIYLGYYDTAQEAHDAYTTAKRAICGEYSPV